jgi:flagellum-specific ATP synthase
VNGYLLQATDEKFTFEDEIKRLEEMFPPDPVPAPDA